MAKTRSTIFDSTLWASVTLLAMLLAACQTVPTAAPTVQPTAMVVLPVVSGGEAMVASASPTPLPATETVAPSPTPLLTEPPTTTTQPAGALPPSAEILAAAPQAITFQSSDGKTLQGTYYPAAVNPAPLVVLMHWAPGSQADWVEIAYWLQDRGLGGQTPNPQNKPWLDASWFPALPEGRSYAVFTFDFPRCDGKCQRLAAQAAMAYAVTLPGVDTWRVAAVGASIGADGAANACLWVDIEGPGGCRGAFSLSPGNYLSLSYPETVLSLGVSLDAAPAWCLYAKGDGESASVCKLADQMDSGENFRGVEYAGSRHGMKLIDLAVEPGALDLLLEFLDLTLK